MRSLTLPQRFWLIAALTFATLIKLYFAATTHGSTDVDGFADHLDKIRTYGVNAYHFRGLFDNPFNSPPPMIHAIKGIGVLADITGLSFGFWLRLFPIIAGTVSVFIVWRLLRNRTDLFPLLLVLVLCPVSIIIDGYHGNTDSLVIMFVLLALLLIDNPLLSGLAFGFACCVKVVPLMFLPAFLLYLPSAKVRAQFALMAVGVFMLASMPFIVQEPAAVKNVVFGYGSIYGNWGIPQLAAIVSTVRYAHQPFEPLGVHAVIASALKYLTVALIVVLSVWLNRRNVSLFIQCGVIVALVLFLAPGFGPQYLVWLVPFVAALGVREALAYYCVSGLYLAYKYLGFTESSSSYVWPIGFILAFGCWLMMYVFVRKYIASVRSTISRQTT